jgi:ketosteroid isomerase-like protein
MKSLRDRGMGKQGLLRTRKKNCLHHIWMCLLPMLLIACSGSLGKIQLENVNTVIAQSETAIEQAHLANAQYLASDTLQQAENALASAKEAVSAKDGLGAMHLAYNALTQAQIAEQEAMYKSQGNGLNAIIKRKEAGIVALEANLKTTDETLEKSRTDVRQLDLQKDQLQADMDQKLQAAEQAHREILQDYNKARTECGDLQSKLNTTQTQLLQAQSRGEEHERQAHQLRRELADAQSLVEIARKEAAEARTQAAAQVQRYSKHIEQLDQSNVLKRQEDTLAQKKQEAKAYVQQQRRKQAVRTNSTSLTNGQIASGRAVISDWALAWTAKDIHQHLSKYTQEATLDQTVIRSSNEEQTHLNRLQMVDALKQMANAEWQETDSKFDADGESVIAIYRFSRLSRNAVSGGVPALHDLWTREVWVHQVGAEWKIFRESWRIYEAVPRYGTAFN